MNALTLLNNFEREFAKPFFHGPIRNAWLGEIVETRNSGYSSELIYDEKISEWNLTIELAGVTKENIKIDTTDGYLKVSGEKTKGFNKGPFEVSYSVPENVDTDKIEASFEDSVLTMKLPLEAKKATKSIEIK